MNSVIYWNFNKINGFQNSSLTIQVLAVFNYDPKIRVAERGRKGDKMY